MNSQIAQNLDWSRHKNNTVRRGGTAMLAATVIKGGEMVVNPYRQRFIWPKGLEENGSKFLTRRVWGQYK